MNLLYLILGLSLVATCIVDVFTSLVRTPLRSAPLSFVGESLAWRPLHLAFRSTGSRAFLAAIGPASVALRAFVIFAALMAGWSLVFSYDPTWLRVTQTGEAADFWHRLYFAGYSLSTLGLGDVVATTPAGQMAAVGTSVSGLVLLSFVVGSISNLSLIIGIKNTLAGLVEGHRRALRRGLDPEDSLRTTLTIGNALLAELAESLRNMPVRHRMFGQCDDLALSVAMAQIESSILFCGLERDPDASLARDMIDVVLSILHQEDEVRSYDAAGRHRGLGAFLALDGFSWDDVVTRSDQGEPAGQLAPAPGEDAWGGGSTA